MRSIFAASLRPTFLILSSSVSPPRRLLNNKMIWVTKKTRPSSSSSPLLTSCFLRRYSPRILDENDLKALTPLSIRQFLRQNGVEVAPEDSSGQACLRIDLPKYLLVKHGKIPEKWNKIQSSFTKVYIDKTTGSFLVPELAIIGDWKTLQGFLASYHRLKLSSFKDRDNIQIPELRVIHLELDDSANLEIWKRSTPIEEIPTEDFKAVLRSLKIPMGLRLQASDFRKFEVRVETQNGNLLFPIYYVLGGKKILVGVRRVFREDAEDGSRLVEENLISKQQFDPKFRFLPLMHGVDQIQQNESKSKSVSVILVSSVIDSVILTSIRSISSEYVCIALAEGGSTLPPEHLPLLETAKRISLWFPDEYHDNSLSFAKKLGEKRCRIMSRGFPNPLSCFLKMKDVSLEKLVREHLRPCSHEYITTFESLRESVYLEMMNYEQSEGLKWKRFDRLNDLLRGFRRGELTIFSGRTGTGKTTFISEYSIDLCSQGVNTLWGSFEVKNVRLAKMQLKQFSQVDLEDKSHIHEFDVWADKFQKLQMYYLTFHGSNDVRLVLDAMLHAVYVYDIGHVIIDNIQFMMGVTGGGRAATSGDRFFQQDVIIEQFRKFSTLHNVHVTLVIHPRKDPEELLTTNSIFGGAKATQEADNVILLQSEQIFKTGKQTKYIQVVKNRFSGDIGTAPLYFNKGTLTFNKKAYIRDHKRKNQEKKPPPPPPPLSSNPDYDDAS